MFKIETYSIVKSQEEISEKNIDPHFKQLFKQIAGSVCRKETDRL